MSLIYTQILSYALSVILSLCIISHQASKEAITPHVETLLALKNEYKSITGKDFGAPTTGATTSTTTTTAKKDTKKEDKKEKKPKEESKPGPSKATTTPAKPTTTPSAPAGKATSTTTPAATVPTLAEVVSGDGKSVDWVALDARLKVFSYVAGYTPTKEDNRYIYTPLSLTYHCLCYLYVSLTSTFTFLYMYILCIAYIHMLISILLYVCVYIGFLGLFLLSQLWQTPLGQASTSVLTGG